MKISHTDNTGNNKEIEELNFEDCINKLLLERGIENYKDLKPPIIECHFFDHKIGVSPSPIHQANPLEKV